MSLPDGFRVTPRTGMDHLRPGRRGMVSHVVFETYDSRSERRVADPEVYWSSAFGAYIINPGLTRSNQEPNEIRARAAALLMAADECDRLNSEEKP